MFSTSQITVLKRLAFLFGLAVLFVNLLPSEWLASVAGKPSLVPTKIEGLPLIVLGLLVVTFVLLHRKAIDTADLGMPKMKQAIFAWGAMCVVVLFVFNALHPDYETLVGMQAKAQNSPMLYASLLGGGYYALLLLPFFCGLFTVFKTSFLRLFMWSFLSIALLTCFSIFGLFLEVQYFTFIYKPTMILTSAFLHLFMHPAEISNNYMLIQLADFSVNVGPACSGFRFATIFTILYGLMWFARTRQGSAHHGRLALLYSGGLLILFVVNALRIAMIVTIGKYYPVFAAALFHNLIGTVMFLFVFYGYIKKVVLRYL